MKPAGPKGPTRPSPPGSNGTAARPSYKFEARLKNLSEVQRLFKPGSIDQLCSISVSTQVWKITGAFPGRSYVPLFFALEAYVGPIAGDKEFSRRMDAVTHTVWLLESLGKISRATDPGTARRFFDQRGIKGLPKSAHLATELNKIYRSLTENEKRILWLSAILHDIGKMTGNRERHPQTGLRVFEKTPAIRSAIREALSSTMTDAEIDEAIKLIAFVIRQHDLVGALAITRDRNIFEGILRIMNVSPNPRMRNKLLGLLALVNFSDVDAQSERGIFTDDKFSAFYSTYLSMNNILMSAGRKTVNSIEGLTGKAYSLAWWGRQRFLAWSRGDKPGVETKVVARLLGFLMPSEPEREEFFATLGKLSFFDGMYNLSTAIDNPLASVKFLVWIAKIARENNIDTLTYDNELLIDPWAGEIIRNAAQDNEDLTKIFSLTLIESHEQRILRLSLD